MTQPQYPEGQYPYQPQQYPAQPDQSVWSRPAAYQPQPGYVQDYPQQGFHQPEYPQQYQPEPSAQQGFQPQYPAQPGPQPQPGFPPPFPQQGYPGYPSAPEQYPYNAFEKPKANKTTLILAAVIGLLVIALVGVGIYAFTGKSDDSSTAAPDSPSSSSTPDPGSSSADPSSPSTGKRKATKAETKQLVGVVVDMATAAKAKDREKMASYFCAKLRDEAAKQNLDDPDKSPPDNINNISADIDGNNAVLHINYDTKTDDIEFKKEQGDWKICPSSL